MSKKKKFDGYQRVVFTAEPPLPHSGEDVIVRYPYADSISNRNKDFTPWLGLGVDEWVWAFVRFARAELESKIMMTATVANYCACFTEILWFLTLQPAPCAPAKFNESHWNSYVDWVKTRELSPNTKSVYICRVRAILGRLAVYGVVAEEWQIRAKGKHNTVRYANASIQGEAPYSGAERTRLAHALAADIVSIFKGVFTGTAGQALVALALYIAMRTGLNTTPLLTLRRDALKDHPFMPNMRRLEADKKRKRGKDVKNIKAGKCSDPTSIPMDAVGIWNKVLDLTEPCVKIAPKEFKNRAWLYPVVKGFGHSPGSITVLTSSTLRDGAAALIDRHNLRADDSTPLRLNTSILRKTLNTRLMVLSDGDIFAVAAAMGHQVKTGNVSYLKCNSDIRKNASVVAEALPHIYGSGDEETKSKRKIIPIRPITLDRTPVASCEDPFHGERAPQDGTPCFDFISCFGCSSFAIVGEPDELYRLFSFYWFLDAERKNIPSRDLSERFSEIITMIDTFTLDKFDNAMVLAAKERAHVNPHLFWKQYRLNYTQQGERRSGNA